MGDREAWEAEAEHWVTFVRTPDHDAYCFYRDSFFDNIMPTAGAVTLEVGAGEGRVTRDLLVRGHRVVALDGSITLLHHAADLDSVHRYVQADAVRLPFGSGSVDIAVAYNSLMDFDDIATAAGEVARVLAIGGAFCICITHPVQYSGGFDGDGVDAQYMVRDDYFGTHPFNEEVDRNGITMRFCGWTRPMQDYFAALFNAGFVVDALQEPVPSTHEGRYKRWHRVPMFLHIRAIKT